MSEAVQNVYHNLTDPVPPRCHVISYIYTYIMPVVNLSKTQPIYVEHSRSRAPTMQCCLAHFLCWLISWFLCWNIQLWFIGKAISAPANPPPLVPSTAVFKREDEWLVIGNTCHHPNCLLIGCPRATPPTFSLSRALSLASFSQTPFSTSPSVACSIEVMPKHSVYHPCKLVYPEYCTLSNS